MIKMSGQRYYVAVKASLYSDDCSVFGLNEEEVKAMLVKFSSKAKILNGLIFTALKGDTERVEKLLKRQSDVDQLDGAGYTALHYASRSGHVDTVCALLAHGANVNAKTKAGSATPLHRAAGAGHLPVVKILMSKGAKIQLLDADGQTALHRAALGGRTDVLETLVTQQTLDLLAIKDVRGRTVLDCAQGQPSSVEFLKRFC